MLQDHFYLILENKDYLERIPIVSINSYDDSSLYMAIVFSLFGEPLCFDRDVGEKYVRSAIIAFQSLLVNTDIVRHRIPVYFFVDDTISDSCLALLLDYGVDRNRIILYDRGVVSVKRNWSARNFNMFLDNELMKFQHVVTWDADLFACCNPDVGKELSLLGLCSNKIGAYNFEYKSVSNIDNPAWFFRWDRSLDSLDYNLRCTRDSLSTVVDYDFDWKALSNVSSLVLSYPVCELSDEFVEFCLKVGPVVGSEELVLSLWCDYAGVTLEKIRLSPVCCSWEQLLAVRQDRPYYVHLYELDSNYNECAESLFHKDIGVSDG